MPIKILTPEEWRKLNGGELSRTYIHIGLPPKQLQRWRDNAIKNSQAGQQKSAGADTKDGKPKAR